MREVFRKFARGAADAVASPAAFLLGVFTTLIWAATGSFFHYSDTWQLVINTGTSIRHVPDRLSYPEYPEPGLQSHAAETGRANPLGKDGKDRAGADGISNGSGTR